MNNGQIRDLCISLLHAETEEEVERLLDEVKFWNDAAVWRHYGDVENNWGQGGNQQSLAEAALVEKIVNSVDARLTNECLVRGINPRAAEAPQNIRAAVSRFFEGGSGDKLSTGGLIEDWSNDKIREIAKGITLCATGTKPILNLTISDCGEGQTPRKLPSTVMSLSKSNKMYVPFVQVNSTREALEHFDSAAKITSSWSLAGEIPGYSIQIPMTMTRIGVSPWCGERGLAMVGAILFTPTSLRLG